MNKLLNIILLFIIFTQLIACSTFIDQKLKGEKFYRRDMKININDESFDGYGIPKLSENYKIKVIARGKIDKIVFKTCHRDIPFENLKRGFFKKKNSFTYNYTPKKIERKSGCLLDIGTYELDKGRHGFATFDFITGETLKADLQCNGRASYSQTNKIGASMCEARQGLLQEIKFNERVKYSVDDKKCGYFMTEDDKTFQYLMPLGECTVYFGARDGQKHRHTMLGYESTLIRNDR